MKIRRRFRVIIAGSRGIVELATVSFAMEAADFPVTEVVSGGAYGVDRLGEKWAREHDIPIKQFIPDWDRIGRSAGFVRNGEMAYYADALVAVWDGKSKGTANMIDQIVSMGKPAWVHEVRT